MDLQAEGERLERERQRERRALDRSNPSDALIEQRLEECATSTKEAVVLLNRVGEKRIVTAEELHSIASSLDMARFALLSLVAGR